MFLLILESLGSTELVFILVMALVFFGPRKLPQISRSLGKNLAEFRRASEEFKRTWDREVTLEESSSPTPNVLQDQNSILDPTGSQTTEQPMVSAIAPDQVIPRHSLGAEFDASSVASQSETSAGDEPPHSPKNDWL
ncbi:MAG TPA: twin-arginine translocase TatA/TatE family subunit [Pyrinomonadaceae bacterium]|nr:twin-arginine translocase TatA/TatE family subunit [Pyrinomonadaceae bacterium]